MLQHPDRIVNQIQANVIQTFNQIAGNVLLDAMLIEDVALTSGANVIDHGLGRTLRGWFIIRRNGTATVYDTQATNTLADKTLNLTASASVTVSLMVF